MITLLLIVGISYIFYRYRSVSNKKFFFQSPFFIALAGSIAILLVSILFVNVLAPALTDEGTSKEVSDSEESIKRAADSESVPSLKDTSLHVLLSLSPKLHYVQINSIRHGKRTIPFLRLEAAYKRLSVSRIDSVSSLGNFGLGLLSQAITRDEEALKYFQQVKNRQLPCLHFCIASSIKNDTAATPEYLQELEIKNGLREDAARELVRIYKTSSDYEGLSRLYQFDFARPFFTDKLIRLTLLHRGQPLEYVVEAVKAIVDRAHWVGFTAATLISAVWLFYIFTLNLNSRSKLFILVGLFTGGALCVPLAFAFYDTVELLTQWDINGQFFNDLFYCIFIIGMSEELVKILPFLIVLLIVGKFKEPVDYVIYASAGALGFAFIENVLYFQQIGRGIIHGRAYFSVIGHMIDSSCIAYGFVLSRFKKEKSSPWYLVPVYFLLAASIHGIYDFLLFDEWFILFFLFFIFIVQLWIIIINNCLNNSDSFSYKNAPFVERSRIFITLGLTVIFAFEYVATAFSVSAEHANLELLRNVGFVGFIIIFFSSNLGSFDLINGYWRSVRFGNQEKRGYGSRSKPANIIGWYFFNLVQPHNYVGLKVKVYNDPYNKNLAAVLDREYGGKIFNRIILFKDDVPDPNWFLVKMSEPLPFPASAGPDRPGDRPDYVLVKFRFQEDSLFEQDEVQVFFKSIVDARVLREQKPGRDSFPSYGWAYVKLDSTAEAGIAVATA